jgi:hypothetical protein
LSLVVASGSLSAPGGGGSAKLHQKSHESGSSLTIVLRRSSFHRSDLVSIDRRYGRVVVQARTRARARRITTVRRRRRRRRILSRTGRIAVARRFELFVFFFLFIRSDSSEYVTPFSVVRDRFSASNLQSISSMLRSLEYYEVLPTDE